MYFYINQFCPPQTRPYVIKPGDTLYKIAEQLNISIETLLRLNPMVNPNLLFIGQIICVPIEEVFQCLEGKPYVIRPADTLYEIAKRFNLSVEELLKANPNVNPNMLMIGQTICIPLMKNEIKCPQGTKQYTIEKGDTFGSLAVRFNTTVSDIIRLNPNVNPNNLMIGQVICIPITRYTG